MIDAGVAEGRVAAGTPSRWRFAVVAVIGLLGLAGVVGQWVLLLVAEGDWLLIEQLEASDISQGFVSLAFIGFGGLVVVRGEVVRYGWIMLGFGAFTAVISGVGMYTLAALDVDLPAPVTAQWISDLFVYGLLLGPLLLATLFPDGRTVSAGWGRATWLVGLSCLAYSVYFTFADRTAENYLLELAEDERPRNPTGFLPATEFSVGVVWFLLMLGVYVFGVAALVARWRRSGGDVRRQLAWVFTAFGVVLAVSLVELLSLGLVEAGSDLGVEVVLNVVGALASVGLVSSVGIAVLKYRLYDVDLVVNRTIVYGVLTVLIVAFYVLVVVGVGALLPVGEPVLALGATAIAAVGFAPVRDRLQRGVDRWLFGRRGDPYGVLTDLGDLMAETASPEETIERLAEEVVTALKVPGAAIVVEQDGDAVLSASAGGDVPDGAVEIPLRHLGETVGHMTVAPRSHREPLGPKDLALLEDIARPAAAVARSVRLTAALQHARERLVLAREEERRRLRRDLHDGLGPSLASQTLQLDAVLDRLHDDPAGTVDLVMALKERNQELVADIRRLVHELRPPTLDELGVVGALATHAGQLEGHGGPSMAVTADPDPLPTLSAAVEVALYRIAREAMTNVVRHARASRCAVRMAVDGRSLTMRITDDGVGLDGSPAGVGLASMRERSEELGGTFEIRSDGSGTEVLVVVPLTSEVPVVPAPVGSDRG